MTIYHQEQVLIHSCQSCTFTNHPSDGHNLPLTFLDTITFNPNTIQSCIFHPSHHRSSTCTTDKKTCILSFLYNPSGWTAPNTQAISSDCKVTFIHKKGERSCSCTRSTHTCASDDLCYSLCNRLTDNHRCEWTVIALVTSAANNIILQSHESACLPQAPTMGNVWYLVVLVVT